MKLYVQEPGTDRLLPLVAEDHQNRLGVLALAIVEIRSAIRRRQRAGDIDAEAAAAILESVQTHMETRFIRQIVNDTVIDSALEMIERHTLRPYDAIQLAGCLVLSAIHGGNCTFVCADRRLVEAAQSEGLDILDPVG